MDGGRDVLGEHDVIKKYKARPKHGLVLFLDTEVFWMCQMV